MSSDSLGPPERSRVGSQESPSNHFSMPSVSMPSTSSISEKLSELEGKYEGSKLQTALQKVGRGAMKGGGHLLIGASVIAGYDKGVTKGESLRGKERNYKSGEAKFRRGQISLTIKKNWGKVVEGLGKSATSLGYTLIYRQRSDTRGYEVGEALRSQGVNWEAKGSLKAKGAKIESKAKEKRHFNAQDDFNVKKDMIKSKVNNPSGKAAVMNLGLYYKRLSTRVPKGEDKKELINRLTDEMKRIYESRDVQKELIDSQSKDGELDKIYKEINSSIRKRKA